jgi:hypothetical protein
VFRCHFTCRGRIAQGGDLEAKTLDEAINEAHLLLLHKASDGGLDGFEIWERAMLLYSTHI